MGGRLKEALSLIDEVAKTVDELHGQIDQLIIGPERNRERCRRSRIGWKSSKQEDSGAANG